MVNSEVSQIVIDNFLVNNPIPSWYELPPQRTRGIPPKRYDPEFEAQRSKYPMSRENNEVLSQTTTAFNTSLYSNSVPKIFEEALKDPRWKKAMKEEISSLDVLI